MIALQRCHNCGHLRVEHEHYRRGSDCSYLGPDRVRCLCMRFAHPVIGWLYDLWDRWIAR